MAASLKIYSDSGCTSELTGNPYTFQIGPTTGLDGTNGEVKVESVWVKNTGTILISNIVLTETSDTNTRGQYSLDDVTYNQTTITLGNMAVNAVQRIYIKVTVPALSAVAVNEALNFSVSGTHL